MEDTERTVTTVLKKSRTNSKRKGNGFESHISKLLSEKLAPMKFRRSQSSGAILGGANEKFLESFSLEAKTLFIGDVVPSNETDVFRDESWRFRFTLECKFYKNVDTLKHLFSNTKIKGWFEQALTDSLKLGKEPLLIFKFNQTETWGATDATLTAQLPSTLTRSMRLSFPDGRVINAFLLDEALLDLSWWKLENDIVPPTGIPLQP